MKVGGVTIDFDAKSTERAEMGIQALKSVGGKVLQTVPGMLRLQKDLRTAPRQLAETVLERREKTENEWGDFFFPPPLGGDWLML